MEGYFLCTRTSRIFVSCGAVSSSGAAVGVVLHTPDILLIAWFWIFCMMLLSPTCPFHHTLTPKSLMVATNIWNSCLTALVLRPFSFERSLAMVVNALRAKAALVLT